MSVCRESFVVSLVFNLAAGSRVAQARLDQHSVLPRTLTSDPPVVAPSCWECRCEPPHLVLYGAEDRIQGFLDKCPAN